MREKVVNKNIDYLKGLIYLLPELPGIYQYFDSNGTIIYIGKAKNLRKRVASYFSKPPENRKTALLVRNICEIKHMVVDSEEDALLLENNLIKKHKPRYNIRLKDDKTYPWVCVKNERFPRVFKTRNVVRDGSDYFGPYTSFHSIQTLLEIFRKQYKLRNCNYKLTPQNIGNKKFRVCLEFHIGNCSGACENHVTEDDYNEGIRQIKDILKGNTSSVIRHLKELMNAKVKKLQFEEAHKIKERLLSLEKYQSRSTVVSPKISDVDVYTIDSDQQIAVVNYLKIIKGAIVQTFSLELKKQMDEKDAELLLLAIAEIRQRIYSNAKELLLPFAVDNYLKGIKCVVPRKGEKLKLVELSARNARYFRLEREKMLTLSTVEKPKNRVLQKLKDDLRLKDMPNHIECFDNSNLQGTNPVAACVVFKHGKPARKAYRHFNIKTVEGIDDFASIHEVVYRRYKRLSDENLEFPQLVVIDGGKGQLSAAHQALKKLGLDGKIGLIGIAKRLEEIYFPGDTLPLYLDKKSESLRLIQQLRDEAHRFGIAFHRQKRSSGFFESELAQISGIGMVTKKKLLEKFKSVKNIAALSFEELKSEIGEKRAKIIRNYFHNNEKEQLLKK